MIKSFILAGALIFAPIMEKPVQPVQFAQEVVQLEYDVEYTYKMGESDVVIKFKDDMTFNIACGSVTFNGTYELKEEKHVILNLKGVSIYEIVFNNEDHTFSPYKCLIENDESLLNALISQAEELVHKYMGMEIFGSMTLGSLITLVVTLAFNVFRMRKLNKKTDENVEAGTKSIEQSQKAVEAGENLIMKVNEAINDLTQKITLNENIVNNMVNEMSELEKQVKVNSQALTKIDRSNEKMDAILENQVLIACNNDKLVSNGTAKALEETFHKLEDKYNEE